MKSLPHIDGHAILPIMVFIFSMVQHSCVETEESESVFPGRIELTLSQQHEPNVDRLEDLGLDPDEQVLGKVLENEEVTEGRYTVYLCMDGALRWLATFNADHEREHPWCQIPGHENDDGTYSAYIGSRAPANPALALPRCWVCALIEDPKAAYACARMGPDREANLLWDTHGRYVGFSASVDGGSYHSSKSVRYHRDVEGRISEEIRSASSSDLGGCAGETTERRWRYRPDGRIDTLEYQHESYSRSHVYDCDYERYRLDRFVYEPDGEFSHVERDETFEDRYNTKPDEAGSSSSSLFTRDLPPRIHEEPIHRYCDNVVPEEFLR